jgi:UDP-N-acetylglucosamine 2-epimerase
LWRYPLRISIQRQEKLAGRVVILGTRPQVIKSAPVIRRLSERGECNLAIIHTGQHYDNELSKVFFNEMSLPDPVVNLGVRSSSRARQTAAMMVGLEKAITRKSSQGNRERQSSSRSCSMNLLF